MLGNQAPDDFHVLRSQPTPLHYLGNKHSQFLAHSISGSQKKFKRLYLRQTALNTNQRHSRHSCALHLLQSGVDIAVIALWLGHQSIQTTHGYIEADLAIKE